LAAAANFAAGFCEWYERKFMPGITYCIADARNVLTTAFDGLSGLLKSHTGVFLTKSNKIYKLRLDDKLLYSLLI
jgi:hypothetical protein